MYVYQCVRRYRRALIVLHSLQQQTDSSADFLRLNQCQYHRCPHSYHIISYHIILYHIIDLKWQNHLKVETDKPKLKSRCSQCQTMMSRKDFLKAMFWAGGERSIQTMKMLHLLAGHHCRQSLSASNIIKHSAFYLRGTIRWVSVFGLSNITNGYGLWMPLYRRVCDSGLLAWSKVRQPVGAVLYSPWTLGMVLPWWYHCKHCHDYSVM